MKQLSLTLYPGYEHDYVDFRCTRCNKKMPPPLAHPCNCAACMRRMMDRGILCDECKAKE